ncbi:MAG: DUF4386 domain-containing protein [Chloroflexota bacterium]
MTVRRTAGALLVIVPLTFTVCFMLLQTIFEYPDILRESIAEILTKFSEGGAPLIAVWHVLTLTAVAFIPVTLLVHRILDERNAPVLLWVATIFGIITGLSQTLGFLRWPFLVPHLSEAYLAPGASEAQRAAAGMVFEAFHRYAGITVGEHLGYLSTSLWTALVSHMMFHTALLPRWFSVIGAGLAAGIATGLAEPAGWALGGQLTLSAIYFGSSGSSPSESSSFSARTIRKLSQEIGDNLRARCVTPMQSQTAWLYSINRITAACASWGRESLNRTQ